MVGKKILNFSTLPFLHAQPVCSCPNFSIHLCSWLILSQGEESLNILLQVYLL